MPISRMNAEAAKNAMKHMSGSALASVMIANPHLFEKHLVKAKAQTAAGAAGPQGYFKKVQVHQFNKAQEFKDLKVKDKAKQTWLNSRQIDTINSKNAKKVHGALAVHVSAENELGNIVHMALAAADYKLCRSATDPETRFLFVTPIPVGYVGRVIDGTGSKDVDKDGAKDLDVTSVVIVINAAVVMSPQLVTVYPVKDSYAETLTPLA